MMLAPLTALVVFIAYQSTRDEPTSLCNQWRRLLAPEDRCNSACSAHAAGRLHRPAIIAGHQHDTAADFKETLCQKLVEPAHSPALPTFSRLRVYRPLPRC